MGSRYIEWVLAAVFTSSADRAASQASLRGIVLPRLDHPASSVLHRLFEATEEELNTAKALTLDRLRGFVVRLRGLPYSATASDGRQFLLYGHTEPV
jgi:hypothetical protein